MRGECAGWWGKEAATDPAAGKLGENEEEDEEDEDEDDDGEDEEDGEAGEEVGGGLRPSKADMAATNSP